MNYRRRGQWSALSRRAWLGSESLSVLRDSCGVGERGHRIYYNIIAGSRRSWIAPIKFLVLLSRLGGVQNEPHDPADSTPWSLPVADHKR